MQCLKIVFWGVKRKAVFTLGFYSVLFYYFSQPLQTTPSVKMTPLLLSLCSYHVMLSKTLNCILIFMGPWIYFLKTFDLSEVLMTQKLKGR